MGPPSGGSTASEIGPLKYSRPGPGWCMTLEKGKNLAESPGLCRASPGQNQVGPQKVLPKSLSPFGAYKK